MPRETTDWRNRRPPLSPYVHPRSAPPDPEPSPTDPLYLNNPKAFEDAHDAWIARAYGIASEDALRRIQNDEAYADFRRRVAAWEEQRLANPDSNATFAERMAYAKRTGRTPDGRPMPTKAENDALTAEYQRQWNALWERAKREADNEGW